MASGLSLTLGMIGPTDKVVALGVGMNREARRAETYRRDALKRKIYRPTRREVAAYMLRGG